MADAEGASPDYAKIAEDFFGTYGLDTNLEEDGIWLTDFVGGAKVRVRAASSKPVQKARAAAAERHKVAYMRAERQRRDVDPEVLDDVNLRMAAYGVIADWEGVPNPDGTGPLPFTPENAMMLLPKAKRFWDQIAACAMDQSFFTNAAAKAEAGN